MKWLNFSIGLIVFGLSNVSAQKIDYNKIILPSNASNIEFDERLVQLAWENHPDNKVLENSLAITKHETKIAASGWLMMVRITGNLNEFNIDSSSDEFNRSQFFPRYNFGVNIDLGRLTAIPNEVARSRQFERIAEHNINTRKLALRAEVLRLYNEFLMQREILSLRSQELEETSTSFSLLEQRFKNGEEQYERYVQALSTINRAKIDRIQAQTNFSNSKLALEEYIGVKLEDVQ